MRQGMAIKERVRAGAVVQRTQAQSRGVTKRLKEMCRGRLEPKSMQRSRSSGRQGKKSRGDRRDRRQSDGLYVDS